MCKTTRKLWKNSTSKQVLASDTKHRNLTSTGIEIFKSNKNPEECLKAISKDMLDTVLSQTNPVKVVDDPYSESDVAYIVVDINPCAPLIREVPRGAKNSFATLAEAKEAARQMLQSSMAEAQKSLGELRQIGIDEICYISL